MTFMQARTANEVLKAQGRWHADPFGFLRPWNEVPALFGRAPPASPPSTRTGVITFLMA
jgi:hypothetical protein